MGGAYPPFISNQMETIQSMLIVLFTISVSLFYGLALSIIIKSFRK